MNLTRIGRIKLHTGGFIYSFIDEEGNMLTGEKEDGSDAIKMEMIVNNRLAVFTIRGFEAMVGSIK